MYLKTPELEGEDRTILEAHRAANLFETGSFQFHETLCLKTIRHKMREEDN